jgi:large subunit ribosomal protein L29
MKASELKELSLEELGDRVKDLQEELFNLRFQHGTSQLENPMRLGQTKKDIARILTVIGEKKRAAASQNEG